MKFQSILIFYSVVLFDVLYGSDMKLSPFENEERLEKCGRQVVSGLMIGYVTNGQMESTTTFISPRHILTSADVVLSDDFTWIHDGGQVDNKLCREISNSHIIVPLPNLQKLKLYWSRSHFVPSATAQSAYIICNNETLRMFKQFSLPMIVEFSPSVEEGLPCLPDAKNTKFQIGDSFSLHRYIDDNMKRIQWMPTKYGGSEGRYLVTTQIDVGPDARGSSLWRELNQMWQLIGVGGGGTANMNNRDVWVYFDIRWILKDLCDLAGICPRTTGRLSFEENIDRLNDCGAADHSDKNKIVILAGNRKVSQISSTAIVISSRHILTTAQLLLNDQGKWIHNNRKFDDGRCAYKENQYIEVAPEAFKNLQFEITTTVVRRAFIICDNILLDELNRFYFPLVLEATLPSELEFMPFCLTTGVSLQYSQSVLSLHQFQNRSLSARKMNFWKARQSDEQHHFLLTEVYENSDDRGGALVLTKNNIRSLIGVGAVGGPEKAWFFDVQWMMQASCDLFGICKKHQEPRPLTGSLISQENEKRLSGCGKRGDQRFGIGTIGDRSSTATLLSSRHALISANVLLREGVYWRHNNQQFDGGRCASSYENSHIEVEPEALSKLTFQWNVIDSKTRQYTPITGIRARRAYIICNLDTFNLAKTYYLPMIVEISQNFEKISSLCLPGKNYKPWGNLMVYQHSRQQGLTKSVVEYAGFGVKDGLYIGTNLTKREREHGTALVDDSKEPWTMIGLGRGVIGKYVWFIDMRWFQNDLCDLVGICRAGKIPEPKPLPEPTPAPIALPTTEEPTTVSTTTEPPPPPSTAVPLPTEALTTVLLEPTVPTPDPPPLTVPTTEEPKTASNPSTSTSHKPKPAETKPTGEPGSWTELETDSDAENEKLMEKNKGMNEFDDWDNDFFEDRNFIKAATRIELFLGVLLVLMVFG